MTIKMELRFWATRKLRELIYFIDPPSRPTPCVSWDEIEVSHKANTPECSPQILVVVKLLDNYTDLRCGPYMPTPFDYERRTAVIEAIKMLEWSVRHDNNA